MNLTRADMARLGRKAEQPVRRPGEILACFVHGILKNPLNGPQGRGAKLDERRYRIEWKDRVAQVLLESRLGGPRRTHDFIPLRVNFLAHTHNAMDGDGLQAALKPVRDALVECGVLADDADRCGHRFEYVQRIDRSNRGVDIRIAPLLPTEARGQEDERR